MLRSPPLGAVVPNSPHATVVSLPTLADVENYEKKDSAVRNLIKAGYPRFVRNYLVQEAALIVAKKNQRHGEYFPVVSREVAQGLVEWAGVKNATIDREGEWVLITTPPGPDAERLAKLIQHTGTLISSRQAEAFLNNLHPSEEQFKQAHQQIKKFCAPYLRQTKPENILITLSGMNAVHAALSAVNSVQGPRGRKVWIQLGWLYVDSTRLLEKNSQTQTVFINAVTDLEAVENELKKGNVAGIFTEAPNNPQLETPDLFKLRQLCDDYGALLVLDPSAAGIITLDVLPLADIVCTSLTKYMASEGNVMAGLVVVNETRPQAETLFTSIKKNSSPLYVLDAVELAQQVIRAEMVTQRISQTAREIAEKLKTHPAVKCVRTADTVSTRENFEKIKRNKMGAASLITIELNKEMRGVYDRLECVKGPSFGLEFTIISPFLWLAHFDEVTTATGREAMTRAGLDPDLLRISIGLEPAEEIWAMIEKALK